MNALASYLDIFVWVELQLYINSYNCQLNEKIRIKKLDTLLRQIMKSIYMICFQHNKKQAIILPSHIYYFVHEKLLRSNQIETYTKLKLIQKYISALDYCEYSDLFKNCNLLCHLQHKISYHKSSSHEETPSVQSETHVQDYIPREYIRFTLCCILVRFGTCLVQYSSWLPRWLRGNNAGRYGRIWVIERR